MSLVEQIIEENTPPAPGAAGSNPGGQVSAPAMPAQGGRKLGVLGKIGNFAKNMRGWSDRFASAAKSGGITGIMDPNAKLGNIDPEKIAAAEHVKNVEYALVNAGKISSIADIATLPGTGNQLADILSNYKKEPARWKDQFNWAVAQLQQSYGVSISLQGPQGGAVTSGGAAARQGERTNARDVWDQKVSQAFPQGTGAGVKFDYDAAFQAAGISSSAGANWGTLMNKYFTNPQAYQPDLNKFIAALQAQNNNP